MSDNWNDDKETTTAARVPDATSGPGDQAGQAPAGQAPAGAEETRQFEAAGPDAGGQPMAQHAAGAAPADPGRGGQYGAGPYPGQQPAGQYAPPFPPPQAVPPKGAKVVNGKRYVVTQILAAVALLLIGGVGGLLIGHATAKPQFGNFRGGFAGGGQGANGGQGFPGRGGAGTGDQAPGGGNRGGAGGSNTAPGSGAGGTSGSNSSFTLPATTVDPAAF